MTRIIVTIVIIALSRAAFADEITLSNSKWKISIDPQTMRVVASGVEISSAQESSEIADLNVSGVRAKWRVPTRELDVSIQLEAESLQVDFASAKSGAVTWPIIPPNASIKAFILPMFEGSCIPSDDTGWAEFLHKQGALSTMEMAMPFLGLDCGERTFTLIFTNPFNNGLEFSTTTGRIGAKLTHEFTRNQKAKEFGVRVCLGDASPIEPARQFRKYLIKRGEFVILKQKIARIPDTEKLLGAAHIYLWGDDVFTRHDAKDFKTLAIKMLAGKWDLSDETRKTFEQAAKMEFVDAYTKRVMAEEISRLLTSDGAKEKFIAEFADVVNSPNTWGDGVSPKMLQALHDAELDRLWLGASNWKGLQQRPETATKAKELGYLIGPYDSYESIHSPKEKETWETAQFDQSLYETGPVVLANGERKRGFQKKGFALNSLAARPAIEARVKMLRNQFATNSWFIDCDAFGQLYDDYSPQHPMTQADDMRERLSRMAWIRDIFGCVIGSEGGSAYSASTIHFAHGMTTPVIGWGDADMKDKSSKYFVGAYYPPDGPGVFLKPVPLKEEYRHIYVDPKFRLPLYEVVFHDSVVATHHWSAGSLKFIDNDHARELLELLYGVPPLYHLNIDEWKKRKGEIKSHYDFFSPLHRRIGSMAMTDFAWLTDDRLVQRTRFGDEVELIANFSEKPFNHEGAPIAPHTILKRDLKSKATTVYAPRTTSSTAPSTRAAN